MDKIEKIRQEIERRKNICEDVFERESDTYYQGKAVAYGELLTFLSTLESEEPDKSLEEAADNHIRKVVDAAGHPGWDWTTQDISEAFIAGAKWQKGQLLKGSPLPEDTVLFQKGVEEGRRLMMEGAVEYEVMDFSSSLEAHPHVNIPLDNKKYRWGDTVRIIIVKEK